MIYTTKREKEREREKASKLGADVKSVLHQTHFRVGTIDPGIHPVFFFFPLVPNRLELALHFSPGSWATMVTFW